MELKSFIEAMRENLANSGAVLPERWVLSGLPACPKAVDERAELRFIQSLR